MSTFVKLTPTILIQVPDCYKIQVYQSNDIGTRLARSHATFQDYSYQGTSADHTDVKASYPVDMSSFQLRGAERKHEQTGIDVPNPQLLRVHAALAALLSLSGARDIFDTVLRSRSHDNSFGLPGASGSDFWDSVVIRSVT